MSVSKLSCDSVRFKFFQVAFLNVHHLIWLMTKALAPTRSRPQTASATWTTDEDNMLAFFMKQTPRQPWAQILAAFPDKTPQQITARWEKVLNPQLIKGSWTREEDLQIMAWVEKNGPRDWVHLALSLPGRIGKQCRERWVNHLSPDVNKARWTEEEDQLLITLHEQLGNQWTKIAMHFDRRSDNCIKNRWNSTLKRRLERMAKGEPIMRKRGRKPKAEVQMSSSDVESECTSPVGEKVKIPPISSLGEFSEFAITVPTAAKSSDVMTCVNISSLLNRM